MNKNITRQIEARNQRIMLQKIPFQIINRAYNISEGVIKINTHNALEHEIAKLKIVYQLKKQKKKVYTEVIFTNGKRADIYIPDDLTVIEVLHSETLEQFKQKKTEYPKELKFMLGYTTEDILKDDFQI